MHTKTYTRYILVFSLCIFGPANYSMFPRNGKIERWCDTGIVVLPRASRTPPYVADSDSPPTPRGQTDRAACLVWPMRAAIKPFGFDTFLRSVQSMGVIMLGLFDNPAGFRSGKTCVFRAL